MLPSVGLVASLALGGCAVPEARSAAPAESTTLRDSLPRVADLPPSFAAAGSLADRGELYAEGGRFANRIDDGDHYHGYDGPVVWGEGPIEVRPQGVVYGVDDGAVVSAGYLVDQADLEGDKSFHGLTLRELDFPTARSLTVDLIEAETEGSGRYLFLWHFVPTATPPKPVLEHGRLPALDDLPDEFEVYACNQFPEQFCPGMGRHHTPDPRSLTRSPDAVGNQSVTYGEAAGRLIFIEYIVTQADLIAGVSWPAMPLDDLPVPPIDNAHLLHFETGDDSGIYTIHMYFLPEETYLAWETEPAVVEPPSSSSPDIS